MYFNASVSKIVKAESTRKCEVSAVSEGVNYLWTSAPPGDQFFHLKVSSTPITIQELTWMKIQL